MWISNGALQVDKIQEFDNISSAKVSFANKWAMLENEPSVLTGVVVILDSNFEVVEGCRQFIKHSEQQED
jgi:hypothetical protein